MPIMIAPAEYHNAQRWLAGYRHPLILTHRRPDGDALGGVAALARVLTASGVQARPALYEPMPPRYGLLHDMVNWHRWDLEQATLRAETDAVVLIDTCAWSQLDPVADFLQHAPPLLVIDHHPTCDPIGTRPGDLRVIDTSAGAVCVLVAEFIRAAGFAVDTPAATALLVGMGTDTGWFRFSGADARLLRLAADMVEAGAPPASTYCYIYEQDPPGRLRLVGRMLDGLELLAGGRLVVLKVRQADFIAAGATNAMTEDLVNEAGRLAGLEATLLFSEEPDGAVRVSLRSKQRLDVSKIAAEFNGGGHFHAAGARPPGRWDEAVPRVIARTLEALDRV